MAFAYNKLYFFRYNNPATPNLPVWDKAPLVIPLEVKGNSMLGVNIHWIPREQRREFMEFLIEYFGVNDSNTLRRKKVRILYESLKRGKVRWALVAIRRYHINRITSMREVPKDRWDRVLKLPQYKSKLQYQSRLQNILKHFRRS